MNAFTTRRLKQLPFLVILTVAVLGVMFLRPWLSFEALAAQRDVLMELVEHNYVLAALGFVGFYILVVSFSLPGAAATTLLGGFLFGVFPGVLFNVTGATVGAVAVFLAARMGLGRQVAARLDASEGRVHRFKQGIDENQWSVLFLIRLVPVMPFFVANVLAAMFNVPLYRYVVTTALGMVPAAMVFTSVGAGLGDLVEAGERPDLGVIFSPPILLPLLGLGLLAALPIFIKAFRREGRE